MIVSEIFKSIQGESTYTGLPCVFVRLAGCNLKCTWCDTAYARVPEGAVELSVEEIVRKVRFFDCRLVEITGGEPLQQKEATALARALVDDGFMVLVETNGSISLADLDPRVVLAQSFARPEACEAAVARLGHDAHLPRIARTRPFVKVGRTW